MAAPPQIILPEVHLDSPIVLNKLLYLTKLGGFPLPDELLEKDPFPNLDWDRIRREENRLSARLLEVRKRIYSCFVTCTKKRQILHQTNPISVLIWPKCIELLTTTLLSDFTGRFDDAEQLIKAAAGTINDGLSRVLKNVSQKLANNSTLFTHNRDDCVNCTQHCRPASLSEVCQVYENCHWSKQFKLWFLIRHQMRKLIIQNNEQRMDNLIVEFNQRVETAIITPEIVVIWNKSRSEITYLTFEMMLMVCDVFEGRMNILTVCQLSCYLFPLKDRLVRLFEIVDQLCIILGNSVYPVVANLESLVYAQLQLLDPVIDLKGDFYSFICKELLSALQVNNIISLEEAEVIVRHLLDCYRDLTPDLTAELLCIMRLWGHPMLSSKAAATKVRESMCAPKMIDLTTTLKVLAFFNGIVINGYRRKHNGIWPRCKLPPFASLSLTEMKHDNSELSYQYILNHWKEISMLEFEKSFDADPGSDLSIFMKDKAISAPRKDWLSVFRKSLIKPLCENLRVPLPVPYNRRLLLNFLADDSFDPNKELEYVTTGAYLEDDQFCASYSLKEKEIKETGRIFAKLTKKMRSCQVMAESLLASHAGKLFKENGVVLDQLSLTKSLLTMSQIGLISQHSRRSARENITIVSHIPTSPTKSHLTKHIGSDAQKKELDENLEIAACFLTTDLSKYCLNWRYQSIVLFANSMNKLYGYNHLFEWIHLRLMRSTLYVGDPFNPPTELTSADLDEVENGDIFVVSPRGGIEGLCQKLWTMISIAVIVLSATESRTRVMSMVQGDNQAMAITTKVPRSLSHAQKKEIAFQNSNMFVNRLRENNFGLGHHLKAQETIISSDFFVYSKRIFWRGRILNQALKNVSKLCLIADILSECTQTSCSNLATTVMRLTENGVEKDLCYFLSAYLSLKQLTLDLLFPVNKDFEDEVSEKYLNHPILLARICMLPSQLGGLNYYSVSRLFNRNVGDPLVSALADLKRFIQAGVLPQWILRNILLREPGKGTWSTLASDPYSINIEYLYPPTTYLKKHTQRVLMEGSVNPMLNGIFNDNASVEENQLAKFLLDRHSVMPRVAHIIIEQTSCGRRKQIQGFLDTTRTIIRYALNTQPISFGKANKIIDYNTLYLSYNLELIAQPNGGPRARVKYRQIEDLCSIDIAKTLRRLSWMPLLSGRPVEGLETPDPLELVTGYLLDDTTTCLSCLEGDSKFTWLFLPADIVLDAPPENNPPIRVPYVGSKTDERRVASVGYVRGASAALKSALRLAGVYIWAFGDTDRNWEDALELANTRVEIDIDHLRALTPLPTSANLTHRLNDGLTQLKFTPASSYAYSSYVHISNDEQNLEILEKIQDSNLIYQQLMLLGLGIIETWLQFPRYSNHRDISIHLHTESSCCIRAVETCVVNETSSEIPHLSVPYNNKFVFDDSPLDDEQKLQINNLTFQTNLSALDIISVQDKINLLAHLVGLQFAHSLTGLDETTSLINDAIVETDYATNWISECLNTYMDSVFFFTAWNILLDLSYQMYYLRIQGLNSILDYVTLVLSRIPGLALTGIASTISHPRILRRMINIGIIIPSNSPYLATLDYHKLTNDAIMWGVSKILSNIMNGLDIELIIPSEDSTELSDRTLNLISRKLTLVSLVLTTNQDLPHVRGLSPESKCKLITDYLLSIICQQRLEESTHQNLIKMITEPKISAFPNNLYYLSRKLLNSIRQSEEAQLIVASYYDSFGFLEAQQNVGLVSLVNHGDDNLNSLTMFDFNITLFDENQKCEKFQYPQVEIDVDKGKKFLPDPPIHHVLRPVGLSSTSWYKGISVLNLINRMRIPKGDHLYLAEGSGAIMTLFESYIPAPRIYYNSYFSSGQNPPQRNYSPLPTQFIESIVSQNIRNEIPTEEGFVQEFIPLWSGNSNQTNLAVKDCVDYILSQIMSQSISLISLDLEEGFDSNPTIVSKALIHSILIAHITLVSHGLFVIKLNLTPFSKFSRVMTILQSKFGNVQLCRSTYSDPSSDEVYIISQNTQEVSLTALNNAIAFSESLDQESFTLISPTCLNKIRDGIAEANKQVLNMIDIQIKHCQCLDNIDDHILLSRLGSRTQTNKVIDISSAKTIQDLHDRISHILTTYFKELIAAFESAELDKNQLLYTAYNIHYAGKIKTNASLSTSLILKLIIRNWPILTIAVRHVVSQSLELGYFAVREIITTELFLKLTPVRVYLLRTLGIDQINNEMVTNLKITFNRAEQKRIWKSLGSIIMLDTIDNGPDDDLTYLDDRSEDNWIERDIGGDEL
ncbi:polymerase [Achimota pararubulavirus 3]|uniref:RNA-directed RNA polymerase L n=1 Tax=Achimota pararubulavirus 3 TaxID=2791004 RepID=A0A875J4T0_9MONO|nr:polymerase [Achimota pararubulavirus 3]